MYSTAENVNYIQYVQQLDHESNTTSNTQTQAGEVKKNVLASKTSQHIEYMLRILCFK